MSFIYPTLSQKTEDFCEAHELPIKKRKAPAWFRLLGLSITLAIIAIAIAFAVTGQPVFENVIYLAYGFLGLVLAILSLNLINLLKKAKGHAKDEYYIALQLHTFWTAYYARGEKFYNFKYQGIQSALLVCVLVLCGFHWSILIVTLATIAQMSEQLILLGIAQAAEENLPKSTTTATSN